MSDLFEFKGAEGAGYAQPPLMLDEESTRACIPESMQRRTLPRWPRHLSLSWCAITPGCRRETSESIPDSIRSDRAR